MNLDLKTRHFQLDDEARDKIVAQIEKLDRFSPRPLQDCKLTLTFEKELFECDAVVFVSHHEFRAKHVGAEPELAAIGAAESLQKQLEKFKGKLTARQRAEPGGLGRALTETGSAGLTGEGGAAGFDLQNLTPVAAQDLLTGTDEPFLVFRNVDTSRIAVVYRHEDGHLRLMEARNE
jgi:ribosome-associated translation inhibitor RaiA